MKRILCYGDSNTWGANAYSAERYKTSEQWPNVLQTLYDGAAEVVQEGLGGRIAGDYDTEKPFYNGKPGFEIALRSAWPVEYVVIGLGTNDLKSRYNRTADQIVADLLWYKQTAQAHAAKEGYTLKGVLYLLIPNYEGGETFNPPQELRTQINDAMKQSGEPYVVLDNLPLSEDGLHWSIEAHRIVAERVKRAIDELEEETK